MSLTFFSHFTCQSPCLCSICHNWSYTPDRFTPGKDPVDIVQEAGWATTGQVWTGVENLAPPLGFDPRAVQSVASGCTDWAIPDMSTWDKKLLLLHGFQDAISRNATKHAKRCPYFLLGLRHNTVVFIDNVPLKTGPLAPYKRIGFNWNTLHSMTISVS